MTRHPPTGLPPGLRSGARWTGHVSRRYEIRPGGLLYIAITLFIAIGAINSQNNLLFWLFGMAVGGIVVSGLASGAALMGLHARRIAPRMIESGSQGVITYELAHRGRFVPAFALLIRERGGSMAPEQGRVGLLEPAWAFVGHLSPGARARGRARVLAGRRGLVRLDAYEVSSTFPFGLFRKTLVFRQPQTIAITPARLPVREGLLETVALGSERGAPRGRRSGMSEEFFGLRAYVPGDSPRFMAWKRSAALGELVVRQNAAPMPPRLVLEMDPKLADADERDRELALSLLSTLALEAGARGYSVGIDLAWAGYRSPLGGGARLLRQRLIELASVELDPHQVAPETPLVTRAVGRTIITNGAGKAPSPRDAALVNIADTSSWLKPGVPSPRLAISASDARARDASAPARERTRSKRARVSA
ncbi:MAG: DUF58 domain-containing protein [Phycisphaerales bacterium JB059]